MAVIKIATFGGLRPSISPRVLPVDAAQVAHNLLPRINEFRPLATDVARAVAAVANPQTLWRSSRNPDGTLNDNPATGWRADAVVMNYVKGQVNDDRTERTYYTRGDGSAPPRFFTVTGIDRQLGVPRPTDPPALTVQASEEFTAEERPAAVAAMGAQVEKAIRDHLTPAWVGDRDPGGSTPGYLKRAGIFTLDPELGALQARLYRLSSTGGANNGALTDAYSGEPIEDFTWVSDPALGGGFYSTPGAATPGWMLPVGQDHLAILFHAYGLGYTLNRGGAETALRLVMVPGIEPAERLLDEAQINAILDTVEDLLGGPAADAVLQPLRAKAKDMRAILDGEKRASTIATTAKFYERADIQTEIATAIENFAVTAFNAASTAVHTLPAFYDAGQGGA